MPAKALSVSSEALGFTVSLGKWKKMHWEKTERKEIHQNSQSGIVCAEGLQAFYSCFIIFHIFQILSNKHDKSEHQRHVR